MGSFRATVMLRDQPKTICALGTIVATVRQVPSGLSWWNSVKTHFDLFARHALSTALPREENNLSATVFRVLVRILICSKRVFIA
jgi:hypothetical protein